MEGISVNISVIAMLVAGGALLGALVSAEEPFLRQGKSIFVDNVWSGASMGYAMTTRGDKQYVAYYDADRWMTVACRSLDSEEWQKVRLDNQTAWDNHNYVTFAFDSEGQLHVSGNMHCIPLIYYRTSRAGDITSLEGVHKMTGELEARVTYPRFLTGPKGEFLFTYRDGGSGNGNNIVNVYDVKTKTWKRYSEKVLFDGEGEMNSYYSGPVRDSKGAYHLAWEWRDTPDCTTNHDISYARSPGSLDNWQKSDGTPVPLPLTIHNTEIIDLAGVGSGILSVGLSLDGKERPMVTYQKYDPKGRTQIYTMRLEGSRWKRYQTTDWDKRWDFGGNGSIDSMISFSTPAPWDDGRLFQLVRNRLILPYQYIRFLDQAKLTQVGEPVRLLPDGLDVPTAGPAEDWRVNVSGANLRAIKKSGSAWVMRWEAMRPNRDRPRDVTPPPSKLELVELKAARE